VHGALLGSVRLGHLPRVDRQRPGPSGLGSTLGSAGGEDLQRVLSRSCTLPVILGALAPGVTRLLV
jgi:hypothetical protein